MTEAEKPPCKFIPNYNQRVLISAKCACGTKFPSPQDQKSNDAHYRDLYDKHRAERYARPVPQD
jgi:hypothetical protein